MATATTAKEESLLEAVASAEDPVDDADNSNDIESQTNTPAIEDQKDKEEGWIQVGSVATNLQTTQDDNTTTTDPTNSTILKDNPYKTLASTASSTNNEPPTTSTKTSNNIGILSEEDDTASVFSFDSYEQRPSIPLRVQNMIQRSINNNGSTNILPNNNNSSTVPFPSVIGSTTYNDGDVVNVCPCRCLFFTLKETICLIMSALGCAVFLAGLVLLCMYLEGSIF